MQRRVFLAAAAAVWSQWAQASGLSALASFLADVQSGDVTFTQTIRPAGQADAPSQVLRGRMRFSRPDRFRFDYLTPYEQVIVADGQAIWLYDVDLAQVSVSDQKRTLANSPVPRHRYRGNNPKPPSLCQTQCHRRQHHRHKRA